MFQALPAIEEAYPTHRWIFGTFTLRNVEVENLRDELQHLHRSFVRMSERKAWPATGWIRSTEITKGKDAPGMVHPHIHVLMHVPSGYFGSRGGYLNQKQWTAIWKACARTTYDPIVDIRRVSVRKRHLEETAGDQMAALRSAVVETLKYEIKGSELVMGDKAWVEAIGLAMRKIRTVGVGGELRSFLRDEEPEQQDLLEDGSEGDGQDGEAVRFKWRVNPDSARYGRKKR